MTLPGILGEPLKVGNLKKFRAQNDFHVVFEAKLFTLKEILWSILSYVSLLSGFLFIYFFFSVNVSQLLMNLICN